MKTKLLKVLEAGNIMSVEKYIGSNGDLKVVALLPGEEYFISDIEGGQEIEIRFDSRKELEEFIKDLQEFLQTLDAEVELTPKEENV